MLYILKSPAVSVPASASRLTTNNLNNMNEQEKDEYGRNLEGCVATVSLCIAVVALILAVISFVR